MAVTADPEHKFELAIGLGDMKVAYTLAKEAEVRCTRCVIMFLRVP